MNILSCETSTLLGSVAILKNGEIFERKAERAGSYSDSLNIMINDCLSEAKLSLNDIDIFASGIGPGSFTGLRISLNTIKTFAYVQNKKCMGIDSLINIAFLNQNINSKISVIINAFKNMVYFAEYKFTEKNIFLVVQPPQVVRVQDLKYKLNIESLLVGDGYLAYKNYLELELKDQLIRSQAAIDFPTASVVGNMINFLDLYSFSELAPLYLRDSEAEENLKGIKYRPL